MAWPPKPLVCIGKNPTAAFDIGMCHDGDSEGQNQHVKDNELLIVPLLQEITLYILMQIGDSFRAYKNFETLKFLEYPLNRDSNLKKILTKYRLYLINILTQIIKEIYWGNLFKVESCLSMKRLQKLNKLRGGVKIKNWIFLEFSQNGLTPPPLSDI